MISQIKTLKNKVLNFHTNVICELCDMSNQKHFELKGNTLDVKWQMNDCNELIHLYKVQLELSKIYDSYIKTIVYLMICTKNKETQVELMKKNYDLDLTLVNKYFNTVEKCADKFQENDECI